MLPQNSSSNYNQEMNKAPHQITLQMQQQQQESPTSNSLQGQIPVSTRVRYSVEGEQKRKAFEDQIKRKKDQLYFQFEKNEEIIKQSQQQTINKNEEKFKSELNRVISIFTNKQKQLGALERKLQNYKHKEQTDNGNQDEEISDCSNSDSQGQNSKNTNQEILSNEEKGKDSFKQNGIKMLDKDRLLSKQEVAEHIQNIACEISNVQQNIQNQQLILSQLNYHAHELFKTKQQYTNQLNQIQFLNETAKRRYTNILTIQYKSQEKSTVIQKDLSAGRQSLREYKQIGDQYIIKQLNKQKSRDKLRKAQEDIITHDMMRHEELEKENNLLLDEIEQLSIQQQDIIQKRQQSKFILQYIHSFNLIQHLFFEGSKQKQEIEAIYYALQSQSNSQHNQNENDLLETYYQKIQGRISNQTETQLARRKSTLSQTQEESRLTFISSVNKFAEDHPNCASELIDKMIKSYNKYTFRKEELATSHSLLLSEKSQLKQQFLLLNSKLEELRMNNSFIWQMQNDSNIESILMEQKDAMDSGVIHLSLVNPKINNSNQFHQGKEQEKPQITQEQEKFPRSSDLIQSFSSSNSAQQQQLCIQPTSLIKVACPNHLAKGREFATTVNILSMEDLSSENERKKEELEKKRNFVFNFFSNYCESILRFCQILELTTKMAPSQTPIELQTSAKNTISFIKKIWGVNNKGNSSDESLSQSVQFPDDPEQVNYTPQKRILQKHKIKSTQLAIQEALGINSSYFKLIQQEKFTLQEIILMFSNCFPNIDNLKVEAKRFYQLLKSERIIWVFSDAQQIKEFLQKQASLKLGIQGVFDSFEQIQNQAIESFNSKLFELGGQVTDILKIIKESSRSSLQEISKVYCWFDIKKATKKIFKENDDIIDARNRVIQKNLNYQRNPDPLAEDFFILQKEEKNTEKIKILKDKKINQSNANSININHTDQNENCYLNYDELDQQQKEDFKKQEQVNQLIEYIKNSKKTNVKEFKFQNEIIKEQFDDQRQQQQQLQQQQTQQQLTVQELKRPSQAEEIIKFKLYNKTEEQNLLEERDKIRSKPKKLQEDEKKKQEELEKQKRNKFFVSSFVTQINNRLISRDTNQQQREKQMRNFSENALVLSKVDRMDRFGGFVGSNVLEKLQEDKNEMLRTLQGELFTREQHYIQPNSLHTIRMRITNQQQVKHKLQQELNYQYYNNFKKNKANNNNHTSATMINNNSNTNNSNTMNTNITANNLEANQTDYSFLRGNKGRSLSLKRKQKDVKQNEYQDEDTLLQRRAVKSPPTTATTALHDSSPNTQRSMNKSYSARNRSGSQFERIPLKKRNQLFQFLKQQDLISDNNSNEYSNNDKQINHIESNKKNNISYDVKTDFQSQRDSIDYPITQQWYNTINSDSSYSVYDKINSDRTLFDSQNIKFYEKYTLNKADQLFDSHLNTPYYGISIDERPKTQPYPSVRNCISLKEIVGQKESAQSYDLSQFPKNKINLLSNQQQHLYTPRQTTNQVKRGIFHLETPREPQCSSPTLISLHTKKLSIIDKSNVGHEKDIYFEEKTTE